MGSGIPDDMNCGDGVSELLFDMDEDPYEQHNLAEDQAYLKIKQNLKSEMIGEILKVRPDYLADGKLPEDEAPDLKQLRGKWPGFHSRVCPEDVMH